tara:strand:+ start:4746 stop:4991 length:246 start_codon:yes stop_codon:yes gene_type:complete
MMEAFEVGDLVRDKLNNGDGSYGLGVIVTVDSVGLIGEAAETAGSGARIPADQDIPGNRYDVYFNKFKRIITFHGDYLEKV